MSREIFKFFKSTKEISYYTKENLKGFYLSSVAHTMLGIFLHLIFIIPFTLSLVFKWHIAVPISLGVVYLFLLPAYFLSATYYGQKVVGDELQKAKDLFFGFKHYFKALALFWIEFFRIIFMTILFVIPGIMEICKLSQTYQILADKPELKIGEILKRSGDYMRHSKKRIFNLFLIDFLLVIASILSLGIAFLWTLPYIYGMHGTFYLDLKNEINDNIFG